MSFKEYKYSPAIEEKELDLSVLRITALWAFSESTFGGILHALTIPFRGLFISSASVLFISLIALFGKNSKEILKSLSVVILVKAVVSPYTPLAAYFALAIQGLLGYLLFMPKKIFKVSAFSLGLLTLFLSGIQKIILLTILFGNTLWKSVDIFIKQISKELFNQDFSSDLNYSYILIACYVGIHLITGLFIGLYAGRLPEKVEYYGKLVPLDISHVVNEELPGQHKRKKRNWLFRPLSIIVLTISISVIVLSYLSPGLENNIAFEVMFMLVRSVVIIFLWYALLVPFIKKIFQKFLTSKKHIYAGEMNEIVNMFPKFKKVINYCWKNSLRKKGLSRIRYFLSTSFYYLLLSK